jgi:hypothetical protein
LTCVIANEFFGKNWIPSQADRFFDDFNRRDPKFGLERQKPTSGASRWIFKIKRKIDCGEIAEFRSEESPGPFSGHIYTVSFSNDAGPGAVTAPSGAPRKLFQKLAGVMVYRDGFGVRIAPDWMEFSSNVTSGGSWYGLRNHNTIGHFDITMEHNAALIEKSDREGFVDTPAWRQFFLIATKLRDEINGIVKICDAYTPAASSAPDNPACLRPKPR